MADEDIALEWDIEIRRGRDFKEPFGFYEDIDAAGVPIDPVDLTTITFTSELRKNQEISYIKHADFVIVIKDSAPTLGETFLTLTDTVTSALPKGTFYYDIMIENSDGDKFTWVYGKATVIGSVTDNA